MKDYFMYGKKKCIVTGASTEIGRTTIETLVDLGADVYAVDSIPCKIPGIKKFIKCDISKKEEIDNLFEKLPKTIHSYIGITNYSEEMADYVTTFNYNYTSNYYIVTNYLTERMKKGGSVAFVTSTEEGTWKNYQKEQYKVVNCNSWDEIQTAIEPLAQNYPSLYAYTYSKRCLANLVYEKAVELGKVGIRINNVMPSTINTVVNNGTEYRPVTPQEIANTIVFLNSEMATYISGIDLYVDSASNCANGVNTQNKETGTSIFKTITRLFKKIIGKQKYLPEGK